MSNPLTKILIGGTGGTITGGTTTVLSTKGVGSGTPFPVIFNAQQIAGLIKMIPCNYSDCREYSNQMWCDALPVFGSFPNSGPAYNNDENSFCINFSGQGTPQYILQKANDSFFGKKNQVLTWTNKATISNNTYGIYQALGSIPGHPTYMNFTVNWGNVYNAFGNGYYRIAFQSCVTVNGGESTQASANLPSPYEVSGQTVKVRVDIAITCGAKVYTVPEFYTGNGATEAAELLMICAAINSLTGPSFPFTAVPNGHNFTISGTGLGAQNGCVASFYYRGYNGSTEIWTDGGTQTLQGGSGSTTQNCTCGLQSPQFRLWKWDCNKAHGTVKFEVWNQGSLGDVNTPGNLVDLCGLSLYDSIRVYGFFGYGKYSYDELMLEYGPNANVLFGTVERVRDKAIPSYKFNSKPLSAWIHKQLATIMMMADTVLASDYNMNNADFYIQRKQVVKKGNYEPKYTEKGKHFDLSLQDFGRRDPVTLEFLEGIQSIIKSTCCLNTISQ